MEEKIQTRENDAKISECVENIMNSFDFISIEKIFENVIKNIYSKEVLEDKLKEEIKMKILKAISNKVMQIYPEGISSLLGEEEPPADEVSYLMIFNCSDSFYEKYSNNKQNVDIMASTLHYIGDHDSKKNKIDKEKRTETEESELSHQRKSSTKNILSRVSKYLHSQSRQKEDNELSEEQKNDLTEKIENTLKFKELMKEVFEDLTKYEESLIDMTIHHHATVNANDFSFKNSETLHIYNNEFTRERLEGAEHYYEFHFEDFIIVFFRLIKFFTGLKIKLDVAIGENKLYAKIFGNEEIFENLAAHLRYDLQLKPYSYLYAKYSYNILRDKHLEEQEVDLTNEKDETNFDFNLNSGKHNQNKEEERLVAMKSADEVYPNLQFHEMDEKDPLHWPPYVEYAPNKNVKYRRYEKNDNFHQCNLDPEFKDENKTNILITQNNNDHIESISDSKLISKKKGVEETYTIHEADCCSKFRNIDKLRIIDQTIDQLIKFKLLNSSNILDSITISRNFVSYGDELDTSKLICGNLNIFSDKQQSKFINTVRNFYGEKVSFYYLWLVIYNRWLIFPVVLGILTWIVSRIASSSLKERNVKSFEHLKFNYYDITLFVFCLLITLWATVYMKFWKQKEQLYKYFWGMENFAYNEPNEENFEPDERIPFLFGQRLSISSTWKRRLKIIVSYFVVIIFVVLNVVIVYLLFKWKEVQTNNGAENAMLRSIFIASINGLQIQIMSYVFEITAKKLSIWENHEKYSQRENAFVIKFIMFEFINKYFSLYYIAFVKPYVYEHCLDNNCLKEIEIQLYIILLIQFFFTLFEVFIKYLKFKWRKAKIVENLKKNKSGKEIDEDNFEIPPHSHEHQMMCDPMDTLIYNYNNMIILFGYVCFFSVAAPLTPLIIFALTYMGKFLDCFSMFYLSRVKIIEGASGISIYNTILKVFYFIGMITNIAVVLFTSPGLLNADLYHTKKLSDNNDFIVKFLVLAILENLVLIIMRFTSFYVLPKWYEHLPLIKSLYMRKYYNRETNALPHRSIDKKSLAEIQSEEEFLNLKDEENNDLNKNRK